jgi:hypothetical protein
VTFEGPDEANYTFNDWEQHGKWDGECGNASHPPELRADHPYSRVYFAAYYAACRDRWRP